MSELINSLTQDEDLRQELWLHYLSGNEPSTFSSHLEYLSKHGNEPAHLQASINSLLVEPFSLELVEILDGFSEFEKTIMCLLVLGYNVSAISEYKSISEVRVRQIIAAIRVNTRWTQFDKKG